MKNMLILCCVLSFGCQSALEERYRDQPHGTFAPQQLEALQATAPSDDLPTPHIDAPNPDTTPDPSAPLSLNGPVSARDFSVIGLTLDQAALDATQKDAWSPAKELTYSAARLAFLGRNPAVAAAVTRYRASHTRYRQVDYLNDLVRQYDAFAQTLRTHASTPHVMPQKPSWPLRGAGRLESELAEIDVEISRARLAKNVLQALVQFERVYHEALYWHHAARVLNDTVRLANQAVSASQTHYRSGSSPYLYVLMAQNRLELLRTQRRSARERAQAELGRLAADLELPAERLNAVRLKLDVPPPRLSARDTLAERVLSQSPDLQEATAMTKRSLLMVQLVERQLLPEISPGTSFTRDGDVSRRASGDVMYATRAPFLVEIKLVHDASRDALAHTRYSVPARADRQWVMLSDALRHYQLFSGPQRRRTRQARDASSNAYRTGGVSFFDLDQTLVSDLTTGLNAHAYRRDAFIAQANLTAIIGLETLPVADPLPDGDHE